MIGVLSILTVFIFSAIHIFIRRFRFLDGSPHSAWISFSGGVAIAYVFLVVLPKLAAMQAGLMSAQDRGIYGFLEHHVYLLALIGFAFFYGLGRITKLARNRKAASSPPSRTVSLAIGGELFGFAGYCVLIGYLLVDQPGQRVETVLLFAVALSLHFVGMDHVLASLYPVLYDRIFRWVLTAMTFLGWGVGMLTQVSQNTMAIWYAFLSGGIIINAIRQELPEEHQGRFLPFLWGAAVFVLLVLLFDFVIRL
jgi:hypothetical protein